MTDKLRAAAEAALEALVNDCDWRVRSDAANGLRAALAEIDSDWSMLEAAQESLREHMAEIHRLRAALAEPDQLRDATEMIGAGDAIEGPK